MKLRPIFCASLLLSALGAPPAWAQALSLTQALTDARTNLEVAIARSGVAAARADILAANHAPLPVLSGKLSSIDLQNGIGPGSPMRKRIDKGVGIDWTWERGGKRLLRTRAAEQVADAAQADLDDVMAQQLLATQAAFFDLLAAQERIALTDALAQDARQLANTAARRVRAGDLAAQEALRIEIEAERVQSDALGAQLDRKRAALALGQLTGRADQADRLQAASDWSPLMRVGEGADAYALAQARPEVRAARLRVQAAQAAVDAARALTKADVTWGVSFDHYPGTSTRIVELRAQMPLQWKYDYQGEIARALALQQQAQDSEDKVLRAAVADMQRLQIEAATAHERARRQDADIVPRARQVAQSAELAYQKGALPLTDLLDARRTLRATLLESLAARADAAKAAGAWQTRALPLPPAVPLPTNPVSEVPR